MKSGETLGLLDRLAAETGCNYMSDLRSGAVLPRIGKTVCRIAPEEYELSEWLDAVQYICGKRPDTGSASEARAYLIRWTEEK
ncbi:MAG: hypothetical protein Q4C72_08215 [Eubacteriales bacterium]|nr:hypothetical protein [Eubacteriales bacterium]